MEKKKIGMWKIILVIVLVVFLIFLIVTESKIQILKSINTKVEKYEAYENMYEKITTNIGKDNEKHIEILKKDGITKYVIQGKNSDGVDMIMTQIVYPNGVRKNFYEIGENKTYKIAENDFQANGTEVKTTNIFNIAYVDNSFEEVVNAVSSKISTENLNGRKCWSITTLNNINIAYEEGTTDYKVYVDKETGLPAKIVTVVNNIEYVTNYEFEFDKVTDNEIADPDITQYELEK